MPGAALIGRDVALCAHCRGRVRRATGFAPLPGNSAPSPGARAGNRRRRAVRIAAAVKTDDEHARDNSVAATLAALLAPLALDDALAADDLVAVVRDVSGVAGHIDAASERADVERVLASVAARADLRRQLREVCGAVSASGANADGCERLLLHGASGARLAALDQVPDAAMQVAPATLAGVLAQLTAINERWSLADSGFPSEAKRGALSLDHRKEIEALRDGGWFFGLLGSTSSDAQKRVREHLSAAAQDLDAERMAKVLERVLLVRAARDARDAALRGLPAWSRWLRPDRISKVDPARREALSWVIESRHRGFLQGDDLRLLASEPMRRALRVARVQKVARRARESSVDESSPHLQRASAAALAALDANGTVAPWSEALSDLAGELARVLVVLDRADGDPSVASALAEVVERARSPFGPADRTRPLLRAVHERVRASLPEPLAPMSEASHPRATELRLQVLDLDHAVRAATAGVPAVHGPLQVAVAGRTKAGKTTLRKVLTADRDPSGIGRGAHRTTRSTTAFGWRGLRFLDTPGVAAYEDDYDEERAMASCAGADAVLWTFSEGLRDEEVALLQRLLEAGKPLLVVHNAKSRVDTPERLNLFARLPHMAYRDVGGQAERVAQVAQVVGSRPPQVLIAHVGAAQQVLQTGGNAQHPAWQASGVEAVKDALQAMLVERAQALRAVRHSEAVRAPLVVVQQLVTERGPELSEEVELVRRSLEREDRDLRAGLDVARLEARVILADRVLALRDRLDDVLSSPAAQDDLEAAWSTFLTSGDLDAAARALAGRLRTEMDRVGLVVALEEQLDARLTQQRLRLRRQPHSSWPTIVKAALVGAVRNAVLKLLSGGKRWGVVAAVRMGKATNPVGWVLLATDALTGAAKGLQDEQSKSRLDRSAWRRDARRAAADELNRLEVRLQDALAAVAGETARRVDRHHRFALVVLDDLAAHLAGVERLGKVVTEAQDEVDLLLARRLVELAGCPEADAVRAQREPGVRYDIWTSTATSGVTRRRLLDVVGGSVREDVQLHTETRRRRRLRDRHNPMTTTGRNT